MPAVFLDRLPLPSLQAYTIGSVLLLACSVHYAVQMTSEFGLKLNATVGESGDNGIIYRNSTIGIPPELSVSEFMYDQVFIPKAVEVMYFMLQEPLCIWTLINMAYCCLILVGKVIQKLVFGDLRVSEQQHIKDKFWNFVFYKFIFIFGVMNVQFMDEVVLWCSWFSVLGFLHLLAQLCKDRCEYLSFSPTTPKWTHCRLLTLLLSILLISCGLFGICVFIGLHAGINTFAFMAAECSLVTVKTVYVILRYAVYLWDVTHEGVWERRASYVYYSELIFELTALTIDFLHHLHMLVWGNIFLSMASLVIAMQLRCLFYEIQHRIKKYKNYLRIVKHMEFNYPMATLQELEKNNDDCAICWDHMDAARKLPCGHLFHNSCLRSWLEQDTSCPTCRKTLNDTVDKDMNADINRNSHSDILGSLGGVDDAPAHPVNQTTNHFFHFDGSRYVSWLPSFSVEVSHSSLLGERQFEAVQTSQLDSMARQVQQMFPNMPLNVIMDDLRSTRSVEVTIENILDEKLVPPPSVMFQGNRSQATVDPSNQASGSSQTSLPLEKRQETVRRTFNHLGYLEDAVFSPESDSSEPEENSFSETSCAPFIPMTPALGCRFSKSSEERERILARRKEDLIKMARRKYMTKLQRKTSSDFEESKILPPLMAREKVQSPDDFPEETLMLSKHQIDNLMT